MKLKVVPFEQPAGIFFLTAMRAADLIRISTADPRKFDSKILDTKGGIQRDTSGKRIGEIAEYAQTVDATFPTAVLLSIEGEDYVLRNNHLEISKDHVADIVDGQHRICGIAASGRAEDFTMPVVFMLDASEEQKALIFATINGTQTRVSASLIYDLFGVTKTRSPQKSAHEIARSLNREPTSPWHKRLKMLGRKSPGSMESLSQGTFVKFLLPHISTKPMLDMDLEKRGKTLPDRPECVFNEYYRTKKDAIILRILLNLFNAVRECWSSEWENPTEYILTKTLGYTGIMKALPALIEKGRSRNAFTKEYFFEVFSIAKAKLVEQNMEISSKYFSSSGSGEDELRDIILSALASIE
jgi:DGQHR domain-containing protein